jgi:hemerythrin-like domain-containing protein
MKRDRREFLAITGLGAACGFGLATVSDAGDDKKDGDEDISAPEDLMREHGVLNRILLVYEEGLRRLKGKEDVPPEVFHKPATLVRKFVEDYHEKLEEKFIFTAFEKKMKHVELVTVLRKQHDAGRRLTDVVLKHADKDSFTREDSREQVIRSCEAFIRMYRPHEAREDTVLFPALYKLIGVKEVKELGEQFEKEEHRLFGEEGFERTVDEVAAVEKQLGIDDLAKFTPS